MFFSTLEREWVGIDRLRLDKYYYMTTQFLRASLLYAQRRDWSDQAIADCIGLLESGPLRPHRAKTIPLGVALHLCDSYLRAVAGTGKTEEDTTPLERRVCTALLQPIITLCIECPFPTIVTRCHEAVRRYASDTVARGAPCCTFAVTLPGFHRLSLPPLPLRPIQG